MDIIPFDSITLPKGGSGLSHPPFVVMKTLTEDSFGNYRIMNSIRPLILHLPQ